MEQADLVDYTLRLLVSAGRRPEGDARVLEYLEEYGIPAPAAVAGVHDLVWTDAEVVRRLRGRLDRPTATGIYACAARAFMRVWAPALARPGLVIPIRDGGRYVSAKIFRPPDAAGRRGKYVLRGLGGRYLWGADEVAESDVVYVVEGEGDKMALDGLRFAHGGSYAVVATGGTGVAGDEVRLERIRTWCDPIEQAARAAAGLVPRRVIVLADPDVAGRRAAVAIATATGAEVALPEADPRDLVKALGFR